MKVEEIKEVFKTAKKETYDKNSIVRQRGENCDELLFLVEGETLGLFTNEQGKVLQIDHMIAPKLLASAVIFSKGSKYPVDVVTIKKSTFLSIDKNHFINSMLKHEKLLRNYLKVVSESFIFITDRFYEIAMKNLVQKVCSYLYRLYKDQKSLEVKLNMSKEELAREFGVARPALSRVFIELEKYGIIETNGKMVKLINLQYIKDYAELFD
ncbi:MAG: Crp/Fnr family transcriptional regulator [Thermosipho sp. (in: Bacteria)]|nr:Crp/Fnr family transcriptional regulator [Thermosipho sp. (in: thermotogales)]